MATTTIQFNPSISAFFNEEGNVVVSDTTPQPDLNSYSPWGLTAAVNTNPPKSSVTKAEFALISFEEDGGAYGYFDQSGNGIDLITKGFPATESMVEVLPSELSLKTNIFDFSTETIQSFGKGVYIPAIIYEGSFLIGSDTVNWNGTVGFLNPGTFNLAYNMDYSCFAGKLKNMVFTKGCKPDEGYKILMRAIAMSEIFYFYTSNGSNVNILRSYREKMCDIFAYMKTACLNPAPCQIC